MDLRDSTGVRRLLARVLLRLYLLRVELRLLGVELHN